MKSSLSIFHFLSVCLLLSASTASAQAPNTGQTKEAGPSFRFAVSMLPRGLDPEIFVPNPKEGEPRAVESIKLSLYRFSKSLPITGGQVAVHLFFDRPNLTSGSEPKPTEPKADVVVPLPAGAKKVLIVLFPEATPEGGVTFGAHPIDEKNFPAGSVYFFNPTAIPVGANLGDDKVAIKSRDMYLYEPPPLGDGKKVAVRIALHEEEGWKLFSSTSWQLNPRERHLVFFKVNPRTKKLGYDAQTDYVR